MGISRKDNRRFVREINLQRGGQADNLSNVLDPLVVAFSKLEGFLVRAVSMGSSA